MTYALRNPNVANRHIEQPITQSQPARPSSGGIVGFVFSVVITSTVEGVSLPAEFSRSVVDMMTKV